MSIRRRIIDYSRGNNLHHFWRLYRLQKKIQTGMIHDILTFLLSRCAYRQGGYIGPDTVIKGTPSLPHGLQGIFISRYAEIGENCWIAGNVTILAGAEIGDGCVIGAGSVVAGKIPANSLAYGNPCRVVREITEKDSLKDLL